MAQTTDNVETVGIVFIGHQGAGKSTIIGRLLYDCNGLTPKERLAVENESDESRKFAQVIGLKTPAELSQGETIQSHLTFFRTERYRYGLVDVPGRPNFLKNMITGASLADVAVLVAPAQAEAFEAAISRGDLSASLPPGESRQHANLCKIMGIDQLVVLINGMDVVNYEEERFEAVKERLTRMLQKIGYNTQQIAFIPCSALQGENITQRSDRFDLQWYQGFEVLLPDKSNYHGYTLLDCLNNIVVVPKRPADAVLRLPVQNVHGAIVTGRIEQGVINRGQNVKLFPSGVSGTVASIQMGGNELGEGFPGNIVGVRLDPISGTPLKGDVMFDEKDPDPPRPISSFTALVYVTNHGGQLRAVNTGKGGYSPVVVVRTSRASCQLKKINWRFGRSTGMQKVENPEFLEMGDQAECIFEPLKQLPLQLFNVSSSLGRFGALESNTLVMIGRVVALKYS